MAVMHRIAGTWPLELSSSLQPAVTLGQFLKQGCHTRVHVISWRAPRRLTQAWGY